MILYHGTTTPTELIKAQGLKVHSVNAILNFIIMRVKNPLITAKDLRRVLKRGLEWGEWGTLRFSAYHNTVYEYTMTPPELITQALMEGLPEPLALEAITALMEVSNGMVFGKIVTVDIPEKWIIDYEEILEEEGSEGLQELVVERDVGPQYIKGIETVHITPLEKVLEEVVGTPEERALAEYFVDAMASLFRGPPSFRGRRGVLW